MSKPVSKAKGVTTTSPTLLVAGISKRAFRARRRVLGLSPKDVGADRHPLVEAIEKAADLFNYFAMAGEDTLAVRAAALGDAAAKKLAQQQKAASK